MPNLNRNNLLLRQSRFLPHVALNPRSPLGARCCGADYGLTAWRDVADFLRDCDVTAGHRPDYPADVLLQRGGTLGAQQALLAALAQECGRGDHRLTVGCGELALMLTPGLQSLFKGHATRTLPLAICYLRLRSHRLQISNPGAGSLLAASPHSETSVDPYQLPEQRVRLYQDFAADWCRAYELDPVHIAQLRAYVLKTTRSAATYEDLLGYGLSRDYQPAVTA